MTIKDIVEQMELDSKRLEYEKIEILENWECEEFTPEIFALILRICSNFHYYSEKKTSNTFYSMAKMESFKEILKSDDTLYMPLIKKDRVETSIGIFLQFINRLGIGTHDTYVGKTKIKLQQIFKAFNDYENKQTLVKDKEKHIELLNNALYKETEDVRIKPLKKKINKLNSEKNKLQNLENNSLEKNGEDFLYIENIVIVDDFVGTGKSVSEFIVENQQEIKKLFFINYLFLCIETTEDGLNVINQTLKELEIDNFSIFFYRKAENYIDNDILFDSHEKELLKGALENIQKKYKLYNSDFLANTAIASFMNAPNSNITILSKKNPSWVPLFERKKRDKGSVVFKRSTDKKKINEKMKKISRR